MPAPNAETKPNRARKKRQHQQPLDELRNRFNPELDVAVALAKSHSSNCKKGRPNQAAGRGPEKKRDDRHHFNAGRNGNERSNTGHQAPPKNQSGAVTTEPATAASQLIGTYPNPTTVALQPDFDPFLIDQPTDAIPGQRTKNRSQQTETTSTRSSWPC